MNKRQLLVIVGLIIVAGAANPRKEEAGGAMRTTVKQDAAREWLKKKTDDLAYWTVQISMAVINGQSVSAELARQYFVARNLYRAAVQQCRITGALRMVEVARIDSVGADIGNYSVRQGHLGYNTALKFCRANTCNDGRIGPVGCRNCAYTCLEVIRSPKIAPCGNCGKVCKEVFAIMSSCATNAGRLAKLF